MKKILPIMILSLIVIGASTAHAADVSFTSFVNALTGKTTPGSTDAFPIIDNSGTAASKKITFPDLEASFTISNMQGTLGVGHGGTGSTTLSGILRGNGASQVQTAQNGVDYTLLSTTACGAGSGLVAVTAAGGSTCGSTFSTTSALYFLSQSSAGAFSFDSLKNLNYPATVSSDFVIGASATSSTAKLNVIGSQYISQKLGIGTTSPYDALSVVGEVVASNFAATTTATSTYKGPISIGSGVDADSPIVSGIDANAWSFGYHLLDKAFIIGSSTDLSNPVFTILKGGNTGIGTSSPWRALSVNGSSDLGANALAGYFTSISTSTASVFPYASTTVISAATVCIAADCRTAWPTGGGGGGGGAFSYDSTKNLNSPATTSSDFVVGSSATSSAAKLNVIGSEYVSQNVLVGTTTASGAPVTISSSASPQITVADGTATSNQWSIRNAGGTLYIATSSPSTFATSSTAALEMNGSGPAFLSIATSTTAGILNLGNDPSNASTTIEMGKIQFDGYNSSGSRVCVEVIATAFVITSGACNP